MPLIITPRQLTQRSELYHSLGVLLAAGLTAPQALEQLHRNPPARALREPIGRLQEYLRQGHSVGTAAVKMGTWMPAFDAALVDAGDRSGRLDACFKLLAAYYKNRAEMMRQTISDLAYPVLLVHVAALVFPFVDFLRTSNMGRFVFLTLGTLLPLYAIAIFLMIALQGKHGEAWRSRVEKVLGLVPVLGTARRSLALARLAAALEGLLSAGVLIITAWDIAVAASGSPALGRAVRGWKEELETGSTPSEMLSQSPAFPELFTNLYSAGEVSGQLDETLLRLHALYQEEGLRKMRTAAKWGAQLIQFGVMLVIAYKIVSYYMGYFGQLNEIMDTK